MLRATHRGIRTCLSPLHPRLYSTSPPEPSVHTHHFPRDARSSPERVRRLFALLNPAPLSQLSTVGARIPGDARLDDHTDLVERCLIDTTLWKTLDSEKDLDFSESHPLFPPSAHPSPTQTALNSLSTRKISHFCDQHKLHNGPLSYVGRSVLDLIATEWLETKYPYLPTALFKRAILLYVGPRSCFEVGLQWGISSGASISSQPVHQYDHRGKIVKPSKLEQKENEKEANKAGLGTLRWMPDPESEKPFNAQLQDVMTKAVHALVGAVYQTHGFAVTRDLIRSQFLSRQADLAPLIKYHEPKRLLGLTLAKFGREKPVSRLLKETGRNSIAPIFIVGVFSGTQKLGEGFGSSLRMADFRANEDALRRLYLTPNPDSTASLTSTSSSSTKSSPQSTSQYENVPTDTLVNPDLVFQPSRIGDDEVFDQSRPKISRNSITEDQVLGRRVARD